MGIKDFFRKVRILLEGDAPEEDKIYHSEIEPETIRSAPGYDQSASAARLAERMADEYVDPENPYDEDDEEEYTGRSYYRTDESDDDGFDDDLDDDFADVDDSTEIPAAAYEEKPAAVPVRPAAAVSSATPAAAVSSPTPAAADLPAGEPDRLPTRTEVTLQQIARLSQKLDPETLREYQMRLVRLKQETGAVSALTALRILHEYVDDDLPAGGSTGPDLSAR